MLSHFKIILAGIVIIAAAGVVTYDIQFFGGKEDDSSPETHDPLEDPSNQDEGDPAAIIRPEEAPAPIVRYPREIGDELSRDTSWKYGLLDPERADRPLGREWENTLWHELLKTYASRKDEAPPVDAPFVATAPLSPDPIIEEALAEAAEARAEIAIRQRAAPLKVQGILCGKTGAAALINGRIFQVGDLIPENENLRVAAIGKRCVVFRCEREGSTVVKHLMPLGSTHRPPEEAVQEETQREEVEPPEEPEEPPPPEDDDSGSSEKKQ